MSALAEIEAISDINLICRVLSFVGGRNLEARLKAARVR